MKDVHGKAKPYRTEGGKAADCLAIEDTGQKQSGSYNTVRGSGEFVVLEKDFRVLGAKENQSYLLHG